MLSLLHLQTSHKNGWLSLSRPYRALLRTVSLLAKVAKIFPVLLFAHFQIISYFCTRLQPIGKLLLQNTTDMKRTEIVNLIREQARTFMPESQTILYGSEARGDARQDSDIDLLILVPEDRVLPEREHFIARKLFEIELQSGVVISSVIMPRKQWDNPSVITPFYQNVKREGVLL